MTREASPDAVRKIRHLADNLARLCDGSTRDAHGIVLWSCSCKCRSRIEHALRVAQQAYTFIASRSSGGPQGKGSHSDPTFTLMAAGLPEDGRTVDASTLWLEQLSYAVEKALPAMLDLQRMVLLLGHIESSNPSAPTGSGYCQVCDAICAGGMDRLKSNLCESCYKAWTRAGRPDRATFKRDRLAALAPVPEAG